VAANLSYGRRKTLAEQAPPPEFTNVAKGIPSVKAVAKEVIAAKEWFKETSQKITDVMPRVLFEGGSKDVVDSINISSVGSMFTFYYDPKWKDKLPYYDMHPLIFVIEPYNDGFSGINLHYLSPYHRAKLMDSLYGISIKHKDMMKLQVNYQLLKSASKFGLFKHCYKRYLAAHVRSRFIFVHPDKWDVVMMLPTAKFVKASEEVVWRDTAGLGK
jgi:hypothetical protein